MFVFWKPGRRVRVGKSVGVGCLVQVVLGLFAVLVSLAGGVWVSNLDWERTFSWRWDAGSSQPERWVEYRTPFPWANGDLVVDRGPGEIGFSIEAVPVIFEGR